MKVQVNSSNSSVLSVALASLSDAFGSCGSVIYASPSSCKKALKDLGFSKCFINSLTFVKL